MGRRKKATSDAPPGKTYCCKNIGCRSTFDHRIKLARHYKKCSKIVPTAKYEKVGSSYISTRCEQIYSQQSNVSHHIKKPCNKKKNETLNLECGVCLKTSTYKSRLEKHKCKGTPDAPAPPSMVWGQESVLGGSHMIETDISSYDIEDTNPPSLVYEYSEQIDFCNDR